MLIKNIDDTLVNGSMGKVLRFVDPGDPSYMSDLQDNPYSEKSSSKPLSKNGKEAKRASTGQRLPVVEFLQPGAQSRTVIVQSEVFKVELPNGEVQVSRTQVRRVHL